MNSAQMRARMKRAFGCLLSQVLTLTWLLSALVAFSNGVAIAVADCLAADESRGAAAAAEAAEVGRTVARQQMRRQQPTIGPRTFQAKSQTCLTQAPLARNLRVQHREKTNADAGKL
jgi:hypothetical protein